MPLPAELREAVEQELRAADAAALGRAVHEITQCYRGRELAPAPLDTAARRAAYLAVRLPATYAACVSVLNELKYRIPDEIVSLLDLGAGPGTAMWAASQTFPGLQRITLVERDTALMEIGQRLASSSASAAVRDAHWIRADLRSLPALEPHDVVIFSYAAGELGDPLTVLRSAWKLAMKTVVILEPGTPRGFDLVLRARQWLIEADARIAAPCPHHNLCPLAAEGDWCHFAVRLERTVLHRRLKQAELGYEDEKFSYVIGARVPARQAATRIVRHPLKHPGHVHLTLCTGEGLQRLTVTKSQKERYRRARKVDWGEEWDESH